MCVIITILSHRITRTVADTHTHTVHVFMTFSQMIRKVFAASTEHVSPSQHKMSMSKHMAYCQAKHLMVCKMATVRQQRVGKGVRGADIKSCLTFIRRARFQLGAAK